MHSDIYACVQAHLATECGSLVCRRGAVAIDMLPSVYPTRVGSIWVEGQAGSKGVWPHWRTAALRAAGVLVCVCVEVKWNSRWPVIIPTNTGQRRGRSRPNPKEMGTRLVFPLGREGVCEQSKEDLAFKLRLLLQHCKGDLNIWFGSHLGAGCNYCSWKKRWAGHSIV